MLPRNEKFNEKSRRIKMKYSKIISIAAVANFTLIVAANADILPNASEVGVLPQSYAECASWAQSQANIDDALTLCDSLKNCELNESDDKQTLIDCIAEAKAAYRDSKNPELASQKDDSYIGKMLPVGTAEQESIYDKQGNDSKGWKNAEQGF